MLKKLLFTAYLVIPLFVFAAPKVDPTLQRWVDDSSIKVTENVDIVLQVIGKGVSEKLRKTADLYDWFGQNYKYIPLYGSAGEFWFRTSKEDLIPLLKAFPDFVSEVSSREPLGFIETTIDELSKIRDKAAGAELYKEKGADGYSLKNAEKAQELYAKALEIIKKDFDLKFELGANAQKLLAAAVISPQSLEDDIPIEILVSLARAGNSGMGYRLNNDERHFVKGGDSLELPAVNDDGKVRTDIVLIPLETRPNAGGATYTFREVRKLATAWDCLETMLVHKDADGKSCFEMPGPGRYTYERAKDSPDYFPTWVLIDHQKAAVYKN